MKFILTPALVLAAISLSACSREPLPTNCQEYFAAPESIKEQHKTALKDLYIECVGGGGRIEGGDKKLKLNF